jgi:outer membrane protein insertion porin family
MALWDNWAELRMPIIPNVLALDWFFDAAAVKNSPHEMLNDLQDEDFRFGIGAGIRFAIPQFPFRLSLVKRFKVIDGNVEWEEGSLFQDSSKSNSGLDFVLSFAITTSN